MTSTNLGRYILPAIAAAAIFTLDGSAEGATTLRVGSLAPKVSSWGKILRTWERAVDEKTAGQIKLDIYYNGVHGMEDAMVAKMRTGQLDGAVLSSVGLADIYRNILALQLPGLLSTWAALDRVREALAPDMKKGLEEAGFTLLSWADVGQVRPWSAGFSVHKPEDIKGKRPLVFRDDPILPTLFEVVGSVVPTPHSVMEVLPALRTGTVNVLFSPGLAMEQLQWAPYVDHVANWSLVCVIGGTVFRKDALAGLPEDLRATFVDIQTRVGQIQTKTVRKDDDASYERVSKKMQITELDAADRQAWADLSRESVRRLAQATFPRPLIEKIASLAGQPL